jgi:hypothetical protein
MQPEQKFCPKCQFPILETYYFCPNCGKNLKLKPSATSALTQIGIYLLSALLPPLGLWPGIKYISQESGKAKIIGAIAIFLTIVSTVVTILLTMGLINRFSQSFSGQIDLSQYQNLGL